MTQPPDQDFEAIYRGDTGAPVIPWDIGEPQPALAALVSSGWCIGTVLDIGCGTGELSLALAARGHSVTGLDVAPSAIDAARRKAVDRGLGVDFHAADATELSGYDNQFDTVLDSGLLHCLPPAQQRRYLDVLRRVCRPGGRVAVLCFADVPDARTPNRGPLTEQQLRALFSDGWDIDALDAADILGLVPEGLGEISAWPKDDQGRTLMTGWLMRAHRVA